MSKINQYWMSQLAEVADTYAAGMMGRSEFLRRTSEIQEAWRYELADILVDVVYPTANPCFDAMSSEWKTAHAKVRS